MDEFEKVRDELLTKQLGKDYKKFDQPRKNMPSNDDSGPLPAANKAKGIQLKLGAVSKDKLVVRSIRRARK